MSFLINIPLIFLLIALSVWDFKKGILPDSLLILLTLLALLRFGVTYWASSVILGSLGYGLYKLYPYLKSREGLGFGDVKMMAASGFWLPPSDIPLFLMVSGGVGLVISMVWWAIYKKHRFPLGPALAVALGVCILGNNAFTIGASPMSYTFSGPSLPPAAGGKPTSLVVLIHGYGADGENLLTLGQTWSTILPHTAFVAPHGPMICEGNPSGKQWFGLSDWDQGRILKEMQAITPAFNHYLDELLAHYDVPPEKLALVGFSQGAVLAIHIALHRPHCAGVVAYSGAFVKDPQEMKVGHSPVLLIHGMEDQVLPAAFSQVAESQLKSMDIPVTLSLLPNLEHSIDERGLHLGGAFLKERLGIHQE